MRGCGASHASPKCAPVFQMFRFEVHVRITEETGEHLQHMSTAAGPSDPAFLFSTLFEGDSGVMVGGSGHISGLCGEKGGRSPAEALLSSLRAEELWTVDELVSRSSGKDDGVFGAQSSWELGFSGDWNVFGSCSREPAEEEASSPWSSEEDQNPFEFDSEESQNLWESLSGSSDPYNPFYFSACTSTTARAKQGAAGPGGGCDGTKEEVLLPGVDVLVSRSDSEISWGSSDGSGLSEEAEQLLQLFASSDPYDPMCFTACSGTSPLPAPPASLPPPSSRDEEELWESLGARRDPYPPLSSQAQKPVRGRPRSSKPRLPDRPSKHRHPETSRVPWTRARKAEQTRERPGPAHKKVPQHH